MHILKMAQPFIVDMHAHSHPDGFTVFLFPKWNCFGHLGLPEFIVVLSSVLGWHQRVGALQAEATGIFFSGISSKFWTTVVGDHRQGVLCITVINWRVKSSPVFMVLLRHHPPCEMQRKWWKPLLSKVLIFEGWWEVFALAQLLW